MVFDSREDTSSACCISQVRNTSLSRSMRAVHVQKVQEKRVPIF